MQSPLLNTFLRNPIFLSISLCAFRLGNKFFWYKESIDMSECPNKNQTVLYNCTNKRILRKPPQQQCKNHYPSLM